MAFMRPMATYCSKKEASELWFDPCDGNDKCEYDKGWYSRLSADGYLDCTGWSGPFETEKEALTAIKDLYEVDDDGNDLDPEPIPFTGDEMPPNTYVKSCDDPLVQ